MRICHLSPASHAPPHLNTHFRSLHTILFFANIWRNSFAHFDHPPLHPLLFDICQFIFYIYLCAIVVVLVYFCSFEMFSSSLAAFLRSKSRYCSCIFLMICAIFCQNHLLVFVFLFSHSQFVVIDYHKSLSRFHIFAGHMLQQEYVVITATTTAVAKNKFHW